MEAVIRTKPPTTCKSLEAVPRLKPSALSMTLEVVSTTVATVWIIRDTDFEAD